MKLNYRLYILIKNAKSRGKKMIDKAAQGLIMIIAAPFLLLGALLAWFNKLTSGEK